jgi:molybdopterin adenylyltransferase
MTGTVRAICVSKKKGTPKERVPTAELVPDHGLAGDAHAEPGHRQVSLLDCNDIDEMRRALPNIDFGAFAENLAVEGIDLSQVGLGSVIRLGEAAQVRVSQIGKACHTPCAIYHIAGDCIMPRAGLFARVLAGGALAEDDPAEVLELVPRSRLQAVVLTVSDRCSRGEAEDTAGPAVGELLAGELDAHIYRAEVIPDEADVIAERLRHYSGGHSIDLVLTVGGTGFAKRDVTPEATRPLIERFTPGLDEAMRSASLASVPTAMLSRGVSGIRGQTLIVNLPGSERGAVDNLRVILPVLDHAARLLRGDPSDCPLP